MTYSNHELYIYIDLTKTKTALADAHKIIDQALESGVPFEDSRTIYDLEGKQIGYIGTQDRQRQETQDAKEARAERERAAILRAENKGLRLTVAKASIPADERLAEMQAKLNKAEALTRELAGLLRA